MIWWSSPVQWQIRRRNSIKKNMNLRRFDVELMKTKNVIMTWHGLMFGFEFSFVASEIYTLMSCWVGWLGWIFNQPPPHPPQICNHFKQLSNPMFKCNTSWKEEKENPCVVKYFDCQWTPKRRTIIKLGTLVLPVLSYPTYM